MNYVYTLVCGGKYSTSSHPKVITTPNYPSNYFRNVDCQWQVRSARKATVAVIFEDIQVNYKSHVKVYSGILVNGKLLGYAKSNEQIFTSVESLSISFDSGNLYRSDVQRGFKARIQESKYKFLI